MCVCVKICTFMYVCMCVFSVHRCYVNTHTHTQREGGREREKEREREREREMHWC